MEYSILALMMVRCMLSRFLHHRRARRQEADIPIRSTHSDKRHARRREVVGRGKFADSNKKVGKGRNQRPSHAPSDRGEPSPYDVASPFCWGKGRVACVRLISVNANGYRN